MPFSFQHFIKIYTFDTLQPQEVLSLTIIWKFQQKKRRKIKKINKFVNGKHFY